MNISYRFFTTIIISVFFSLCSFVGCSAQYSPNHDVASVSGDEDCRLYCGNEQFNSYVPYLIDKRVALVVNHASIVDGVHLCDTLLSQGVNIVSIFAPEHGFRGKADAGEIVEDNIDSATRIPIVSLYGQNKRPSQQQLSNVDVVVYDLQDVGVRFYTYISTLHYVMDACAEYGKTLIILDRPNPNGNYVDGPVLSPECRSFVGVDPLPIVYGLTPAELACMINGEDWLEEGRHCDLKVVKMLNYDYSKQYDIEIAPSPNLRNTHAIRLYPSLCLFEATNVSVGRGTETPFEIYGAPQSDLGTYTFVPVSSEGAKSPLHQDVTCYGVDMRNVVDSSRIDLSYFIDMHKKMGSGFWKNPKFFDLLAGVKTLRSQIDDGISEESIRASWSSGLDAYKSKRERYLLYNPSGTKDVAQIDWEQAMHTVWVDSVYASMTDEERMAQLIAVTLDVNPSEASIKRICDVVEQYNVGGVLVLKASVHQIKYLVERISSHAKYPLLFSVDAESGLGMKFDDVVVYPKNMSLGAIRDHAKLFDMGVMIGKQLKACGLDVDYAPVVDVNTNPLNPIIGIRSFGESASRVAACGMSITRGIQSQGVVAVLKHFPGHGDTDKDSHLLLPAVTHDRSRLDTVELFPFRKIVDDGVMGVMSAHLIVPALDSTRMSSSMSYPMLTDILREKMNFKGLIISDALNMQGALTAAAGKAPETLAIKAGNDIAEFSINVPRAIPACLEMLETGELDRIVFEEKVRRVLAAKQWCGLDNPRHVAGDPSVIVNSLEAELFARELFAATVTVLDSTNTRMPVGKVVCHGEWTVVSDNEMADDKNVWIFADDTSLSQCQASLDAERARGARIVVVYAGNPYRLKKIDWSAYKCGLVIAYENVATARKVLVDFVLKGGKADGVMPVSVANFKEGEGIVVDRQMR